MNAGHDTTCPVLTRRKVIAIILQLVLVSGFETASAQLVIPDTLPGKGIVMHEVNRAKRIMDYFLDLRDRGDNRDTDYVVKLPNQLMLTTSVNMAAANMELNGRLSDYDFTTKLQARNAYTLSLHAIYRGLSIGISANPFNMFGKNSDFEMAFNFYGDKFGGDVMLHSGKSFKGTFTIDSIEIDIPRMMVSQRFFALNAYYAFNGKRFSYAAAYDHTSWQKISCGSLLIGGTLMDVRMHVDYGEDSPDDLRIHTLYAGLGAGYTFNFSLPHHWLINVSGLSELVLLTHSRLRTATEEKSFPRKSLPVIFIGRTAVVKHFKNFFVALTAVVNTMEIGSADRLQMKSSKGNASMVFGIKL